MFYYVNKDMKVIFFFGVGEIESHLDLSHIYFFLMVIDIAVSQLGD
jgi:hypothetical protein